jgi:hypothetical protein
MSMISVILRVLSGLVIGLIYAGFAGAVSYYCFRLNVDPEFPGPMIPNKLEWARLIAIFVTVGAAVLGGLVGVVVSLVRISVMRGALIGGGVGLVLYIFFVADLLKDYSKMPIPRPWPEASQTLGLFFVLLPFGLTLTGLAAAAVAGRLRLWLSS